MRIMVVSPVRLFRDCVAAVLGSMQPVPEVVAEVSITALYDRSPGEQPDVVLVDVTQDIGMEEVALVAAKWPNLPLLALGLLERREEVLPQDRTGFVAYVARNATIRDLQSAISDAVAGRIQRPAEINGGLVRALFNRQQPSTPWRGAPSFTKRETEVPQMIGSFPSVANIRTRSPPANQIAEEAGAANSRPVDPIPGPSTIGRDKPGVLSAKGVE